MFDNVADQYWKTVVNTIQDGIMIVDETGTIVTVNKAFEKILKYTKSELLGKTCEVLNCDICEAARAKVDEHWCVLFRTGSIAPRKCTLLRKDGKRIHAFKNAALLFDHDDRVIGAVETITDVTEIIEKDIQIRAIQEELRSKDRFSGIIGVSPAMLKVFELIKNAAHSDAPVIIFGESGTGKELVSQAIVDTDDHKDKPFVKVNCAALTESLLESELFGHVRGAYTGAHKDRAGRFETASGGNIFLDEIGDLPLSTQVKLLRVLEEKVIERVGDSKPINVNVRIISATNKNLQEMVQSGTFRNDLFFRINVIPIYLPPLRERKEDIPLLAESFFRTIQIKSGSKINGVSRDTLDILMGYNWPGNVRELKSAFEYAVVTCHENMIEPHHLPYSVYNGSVEGDSPVEASPVQHSKPNTKARQEKAELVNALEKAEGNQTVAARILGVTRVTVWNRMKKHNITKNQTYK